MTEDKGSDSGFKVVDRRPFSVDGTRREDVKEETRESKPEPRVAAPDPRAAVSERTPDDYLEPEGSKFEALVSDLSKTAMFQLGLLQEPGGELIPPDLPSARFTIDLLDELKEKTRGNLTPREGRLLEGILYELRLTYVEVQKGKVRKKK